MPRRREVPKRKINKDPKYHDWLVAKFTNCLMYQGKKSIAEKIVYDAFDMIEGKMNEDPLKVFKRAIENVEIRPERKVALAIRWIIGYSRSRGEKSMDQKLAAELMDAAAMKGSSIKKKDDTHRMAEANKAFAHYRW